MTYNGRATDDYRAEPRRGTFDSFMNRLKQDPRTDPVAEGEPAFEGGIYGRWRARAAANLRLKVGRRVAVWFCEAHPVTGEPRYFNL